MSQRAAARSRHKGEDFAVAIGVRSADRAVAAAPVARKMPGGFVAVMTVGGGLRDSSGAKKRQPKRQFSTNTPRPPR